MFNSLAFVGGWVEQIGALPQNSAAVDLGIVSSLLLPADALRNKPSLLFQPKMQLDLDMAGPFVVTSEPSELMVIYAAGYVIILLLLTLWSFSRRDL